MAQLSWWSDFKHQLAGLLGNNAAASSVTDDDQQIEELAQYIKNITDKEDLHQFIQVSFEIGQSSILCSFLFLLCARPQLAAWPTRLWSQDLASEGPDDKTEEIQNLIRLVEANRHSTPTKADKARQRQTPHKQQQRQQQEQPSPPTLKQNSRNAAERSKTLSPTTAKPKTAPQPSLSRPSTNSAAMQRRDKTNAIARPGPAPLRVIPVCLFLKAFVLTTSSPNN